MEKIHLIHLFEVPVMNPTKNGVEEIVRYHAVVQGIGSNFEIARSGPNYFATALNMLRDELGDHEINHGFHEEYPDSREISCPDMRLYLGL